MDDNGVAMPVRVRLTLVPALGLAFSQGCFLW